MIMLFKPDVEGSAMCRNNTIACFNDKRPHLILRNLEPGLTSQQLHVANLSIKGHSNAAFGIQYDGRAVG